MDANSQSGFTLIEIMIALFIFAMMAVMAVVGMRSLMDSDGSQKAHIARLSELQMSNALLSRDLSQIVNRPIRLADKEAAPGFIGHASTGRHLIETEWGQALFEFTRLGLANPLGQEARSTLLRVGYYLRDDALWRLTWSELDRTPQTLINEAMLLDDIRSVRLAYLDFLGGYQNTWLLDFPGLDFVDATNHLRKKSLPAALSLQFVFDNEQQLEWYWLLPGGRRDYE